MKSNPFLAVLLLLATMLLTACGGGGGDSSAPPPPPPPPPPPSGGSASSTYLFYAGSLNAVDPANPASPLTVEAGSDIVTGPFGAGASAQTIMSGTYDGAAQTITGFHAHALMYAKTNGKLYRVSALKSGSLTPVQVSSESGANKLCPMIGQSGMDLANPDNSQYVYSLSGSDSMCGTGDDVWKMVRLGMSAGEAPVAAKPPVSAINNASAGAIAGWLVKDEGALKRCDANFANCNVVANTLQVLVLDYLGIDRYVMNINGQIVVYNGAANTLSSPVFTIPAGSGGMMMFVSGMDNDGTTVYFAHGKSVYRFPVDGGDVATPLISEAVDIRDMGLTANKVVYQIGNEIKAVSKTGGTPSTLAAATGSDSFASFVIGNKYVYYDIVNDANTARVAAGIVDENGGGQSTTPNAAWVGVTLSTTISFNAGTTFGKVIRAEGGMNNGFGGATLKSFNAATAVEVATLGTLSAADNWTSFHCFTFSGGDNVLCSATMQTPVQSDIFL